MRVGHCSHPCISSLTAQVCPCNNAHSTSHCAQHSGMNDMWNMLGACLRWPGPVYMLGVNSSVNALCVCVCVSVLCLSACLCVCDTVCYVLV